MISALSLTLILTLNPGQDFDREFDPESDLPLGISTAWMCSFFYNTWNLIRLVLLIFV